MSLMHRLAQLIESEQASALNKTDQGEDFGSNAAANDALGQQPAEEGTSTLEAVEDEVESSGWGEWWEEAEDVLEDAWDVVEDVVEDIVEDVGDAVDGISDAIRDGLADWGIDLGGDQGQGQDQDQDQGPGEDVGGGEVVEEEADHYAVVTEANAYVREGPPNFATTGTSLVVDSKVHVQELAYKSGQYKGYARVTDAETDAELGWTWEGNLTSCYDIDEDWQPDEALDLSDLEDDELVMAKLYNEKGALIETEAEALGITAAQAAATMIVESGGRGYGCDGRMIIRFENHRFYSDWGEDNAETYAQHFKYNTTEDANGDGTIEVWNDHQWRENVDDAWQDVHQNQSMEYEVFTFASGLGNGAEEAAAGAISMGAGQTMGRDWHEAFGYDSALDMMTDMQENPEANIGGIFSFIENNDVAQQALVDEDYVAFATQYNGPGKAQEYGDLIEDKVAAYESMMEKKGPQEEEGPQQP